MQDNLLTEAVVKTIYGNDMTVDDISNGTIDLLKWGLTLKAIKLFRSAFLE